MPAPSAPPFATAPLLLSLSLAAALAALSLRLTDALLPVLGAQFGVGLAEVAWVVTGFALAYGLSLLILGPLGDRFGKLRVMVYSCAASAASSLACAWAPDLPALVLARAATGVATAALIPMSMAWIGDHIPYAHRQPVLARFLLGQILGMALGAGLGGLAADVFTPAAVFASLGLAFALLGLRLARQVRQLPASATTGRGDAGLLHATLHGMQAVLGRAGPRRVLRTAATEGALLFGVVAFAATHVHQQHGLRLALAAGVVMLFGLGGVLYALCAPRLLARCGERGLVLAGGSTLALALLALAWSPWWWGAVPACTASGLGFYMLHNTLQTQATQMAPAYRGAAVSLYACSFFLGQALGVVAFGALLQVVSSAIAISACALGLLLLAAGFAQSLPPRKAGQ